MSPEEKIRLAIASLQTPAGSSERFSTFEAVRKNHEAFVVACHDTWKNLQSTAIREVFYFDGFARREQTHPIGHGTAEYANYNRAVWRRVNDSIVWSLFGVQRHVVKRLCLYRPRSYLTESNASSVLRTLDALNTNPLSFALWNDATSCVDVGDVTYIEDGRVPVPTFIELKEGHVNDEILALLNLEGVEFNTAFKAFSERYSNHGVKQFHRVLRQKRISDQALTLLAEERGVDPVTGQDMEVVDVGSDVETYDETLNKLLSRSIATKAEVFELNAGCIWIYANADPNVSSVAAVERFVELLTKNAVTSLPSKALPRLAWDRDRIMRLSSGVFFPMAKPLFLRPLDAHVSASVTFGELSHKTLLYLDWERFVAVAAAAGARFSWSSEKAARRARSLKPTLRPPVFRGRLAEVHVGAVTTYITDPGLVQMYFDGVTPGTLIKKLIRSAERVPSGK